MKPTDTWAQDSSNKSSNENSLHFTIEKPYRKKKPISTLSLVQFLAFSIASHRLGRRRRFMCDSSSNLRFQLFLFTLLAQEVALFKFMIITIFSLINFIYFFCYKFHSVCEKWVHRRSILKRYEGENSLLAGNQTLWLKIFIKLLRISLLNFIPLICSFPHGAHSGTILYTT